MKTLSIVPMTEINQATKDLRYRDYRTSQWLGETQRWAWDGGDALVVVTGTGMNVVCYTVIRVGKEVTVHEGPLNNAMIDVGLNPLDFKICG